MLIYRIDYRCVIALENYCDLMTSAMVLNVYTTVEFYEMNILAKPEVALALNEVLVS
jgi:hypothetical protein